MEWVEVFLFTGDRLLTGLQLNYLYQFSVSPGSMTVIYQETLFRTNQQNNVNIFSANLDVPLSAQWSMNAFYRYVDDQCNFPFFSYSDHNMGLNLSWALL
jgi:hypothetical protein